jgi:hypothetical protein
MVFWKRQAKDSDDQTVSVKDRIADLERIERIERTEQHRQRATYDDAEFCERHKTLIWWNYHVKGGDIKDETISCEAVDGRTVNITVGDLMALISYIEDYRYKQNKEK